jgi:hypothetical protein
MVRAWGVWMIVSQGLHKGLAADLLSRSLRQKGRAREPSCSRSRVDPIDQRLVERDIDPHRSASIGEQGNGEQHCAALDGRDDILVEQNLVYRARRRHASACALNGFHMLTKRCSGIGNSLFHRIASRETPLDVRKPYAKGAIRLLFDDSYVVHWQTIRRGLQCVSPPPCGEGSGVGVNSESHASYFHPTPNPSPSRGGESAQRVQHRRRHQ